MIGGPDEDKTNFLSDSGFVASISCHGGSWPPSKGPGEWLRWDGSSWSVDEGVTIVTDFKEQTDIIEDLKGKQMQARQWLHDIAPLQCQLKQALMSQSTPSPTQALTEDKYGDDSKYKSFIAHQVQEHRIKHLPAEMAV